jgi:hypothetical protein
MKSYTPQMYHTRESFRDEKLRPWQRNKRVTFWAQEGEGFLSTIQLQMSKATLSRILTIAGNSPNEKLYCTIDPQENIQYLKGLVYAKEAAGSCRH